MIYFGIFCTTIIAIVYIVKKYSCKHEWIEQKIEYTESVMGLKKYKIITQKCEKCGKIEIDKYHIN
jgi:hypothetical protein